MSSMSSSLSLSCGGGFVIIPLRHADGAVALGQITPGLVVHKGAVVGYAAAGLGG
jgi:chromate transporter